MGHFGPENGTSSKLYQPEEFFSKFCRVKGANRYIKVLLVVFREKLQFELIFLAFRPFFTV